MMFPPSLRSVRQLSFVVAAIIIALLLVNVAQARQRCLSHSHGAYMEHPSHAGHVYLVPTPAHGGYATPVAKPAYAYGWFGVRPRCHKGVHHGHYHNYTQWSYR